MTSILQCPVCHESLLLSADGYQCSKNHTFDAARQGYVNLLLVQKKRSKEPGDNPDMIKSRRRFLDLGLYNKVSDGVNDAIANALGPAQKSAFTVLDAGCGEGFYLKRLKEFLAHSPGEERSVDYYGIDISKFAVRHATQRDKTMSWFVASINDLPFMPSSFDIIVNIFSPANVTEFSRTLKEAGALVIASPGPRHLNGLREIIYPIAREHAAPDLEDQAKGLLALSSTARVNYRIELRGHGEIMDLLAMTPYFWNIDRNTKSKVEALEQLATDVDVEIRVFRKSKNKKNNP